MKMGDKKPDIKPVHVFYIAVIVVIFLMNFFILPMVQTSNIIKTDYNTFMDDVESKMVTEVTIDDDYIYYVRKEGEKEIVIYSFLGYQKWSIFNYFLLINVILILGGMLISLTLLFFTSLILPMLDSSITSVYLSFLPFGLIIMVCLFSFIISSLINMRFFIKKDVISLLKN